MPSRAASGRLTKIAAAATHHATRTYQQIAEEILADAGRLDAAEDELSGGRASAVRPCTQPGARRTPSLSRAAARLVVGEHAAWLARGIASDGRGACSAGRTAVVPRRGPRPSIGARGRVAARTRPRLLPARAPAEREITLFDIGVYPLPAISLAGPYLGYAGIVSEPDTDDSVVVDLRRNEDVVLLTKAGGGVGSLTVNRRGSVAWIVCPFGQLAEGLDCTTASGERSDRTARSIYRHDTRSTQQAPVQLVARSRRIEIGSLRRKGDRIYWKQAGRTREGRILR
jgi:hypothetical protein